jgi:katanin p60 ATPase-containing subunit A1
MAQFYAPTTIFIDEVDAIGSKRQSDEDDSTRRVKTEFLINMDGCNTMSSANVDSNKDNNNKDKDNKDKGEQKEKKDSTESRLVMVLGATNRPWDLDEALIRRFEKRIYIPLPNEKGREELFKLNLKGVDVDENINFSTLVKRTENYSGADIANVCREAALMGMRRRLLNNQVDISNLVKETGFRREINAPISEQDLLESINNISKSVSDADLKHYEEWTKEYKSV